MKNTDQIYPEYRAQFLSLVEKHSAATANGESAKANKIHKQLHKLYFEIRQKNMTSLFQEFFESENESLQMWSAVFSLRTDSKKAEHILETLSRKESIIALTAGTLLQLWRLGKLELL